MAGIIGRFRRERRSHASAWWDAERPIPRPRPAGSRASAWWDVPAVAGMVSGCVGVPMRDVGSGRRAATRRRGRGSAQERTVNPFDDDANRHGRDDCVRLPHTLAKMRTFDDCGLRSRPS